MNLGQVESWIVILDKDARKKEDQIFRGIQQCISLAGRMVSQNPEERPSAREVQERMFSILSETCSLGPAEGDVTGKIHCSARKEESKEWNFGFDELRLASQRAAAEACASVNPIGTNEKTLGLNGGVIYGVERVPSLSTVPSKDPGGDRTSMSSRSRSSEGKSRSGSGSLSTLPGGKAKPKAKAWQAPVYAGMFLSLVRMR